MLFLTPLLLGVVFGVITGLMPGLHPNTIFMIILGYVFINPHAGYDLLIFITAFAITNTFTDFIPSILLGAPEEDSVLSTLPAHRMLMKGHGYEAVFLTVIGGIGVGIIITLSMPFLYLLIPFIYNSIKSIIHIILISVLVWMVISEKGKRTKSIFIISLSGLLGVLTLNTATQTSLFPALSGMFGVSMLILSLTMRVKIPEQTMEIEEDFDWFKGSVTGWVAGIFSALLPGVGSSQSGVIASQMLKAKIKEFMIALGGINTSNMFFTLFYLFLLGKTRSGAAWFLSQIFENIDTHMMIIITLTALSAMFISAIITLGISKVVIKYIKSINYMKLNAAVLFVVIFIVFIETGIYGMFVLATSTFLGMITSLLNVRRSYMMGYLLIPTILYFSGFSYFTYTFM